MLALSASNASTIASISATSFSLSSAVFTFLFSMSSFFVSIVLVFKECSINSFVSSSLELSGVKSALGSCDSFSIFLLVTVVTSIVRNIFCMVIPSIPLSFSSGTVLSFFLNSLFFSSSNLLGFFQLKNKPRLKINHLLST